ncbi:MAG TPA: VacJ family lipoprotein, partial [Pseudomonadales bacterium]|nr:VacJ family lipoprotein [Pseudomonadales bacterium]
KVYSKVIPAFARHGVKRFFENLGDVNSSVNSFLQGKPREGITDLGRVVVNSTIGVGGLFDPATSMGLKDHDEDFGQTFAVWGIPRGPYLELPFLGPSTLEDAFGKPFNTYADPLTYLYPARDRNTLMVLRVINDRAALLPMEGAVFGDEYIFYRDAYLQRRNYLIKDGKVKDTFGDDF